MFPERAFQFVREGLQHTVQVMHPELAADLAMDMLDDTDSTSVSEQSADQNRRHVTGQQLCLGLRDYAIRQYGMLARTVLTHWNVRRTEDFGRIVFAMVAAGELRKSDDDSPTDFREVFDFDEAFADLRASKN